MANAYRALRAADRNLVQILDSALAEAARKSGGWLACRLGCTDCCKGPFPITRLDALRLRAGLEDLADRDPERAARVRERAREAIARLEPGFPVDLATGAIEESVSDAERFDGLANDDPCPALDPVTGGCDLYAARPVTCRVFGPSIRYHGEAIGVCELCYRGASDEEIAACAVEADAERLEDSLIRELEATNGPGSQTLVAFALVEGL